MNSRAFVLSATTALVIGVMTAGSVQAGGPVRTSDSYTETFHDEFILDLCGIETLTTVTERWTLKEFADGSATLHVNRTFVPEDPRLPIEKGAATSFFAPDGTQTVVGKPIQLFWPKGGVRLLDAGWVEFGDELTVRGPHPSLDVDLALYYCP
ncbi:hypothetical protein BH24CHL6_BH24CHL6_05030 [soil metagenome]